MSCTRVRVTSILFTIALFVLWYRHQLIDGITSWWLPTPTPPTAANTDVINPFSALEPCFPLSKPHRSACVNAFLSSPISPTTTLTTSSVLPETWAEILISLTHSDSDDEPCAKAVADIVFRLSTYLPTETIVRPFALAFHSNLTRNSSSTTDRQFFLIPPRFPHADAGHCFGPYGTPAAATFKCLPSLLVIGFQRAGTRELHEWLEAHPNLSALKTIASTFETHFFDSLTKSHRYHLLQPLRRAEIKGELSQVWLQYLRQSPELNLAEVLTPVKVFEKTPAYADETDPALIASLLPTVRLVVSLREPGSRLYSEYWRRCQRFYLDCSVAHFERDIVNVAERTNFSTRACGRNGNVETYQQSILPEFQNDGFHVRSVVLGAYAHYLKRYTATFTSRASLFVMFLESFVEDPFTIMTEVEDFAMLRTRFNYQAAAHRVGGFWAVSRQSRAYQDKPEKFVSFSQLPMELKDRLNAMYKQCVMDVKEFIASPRRDNNNAGLVVRVSRLLPSWVM